MSTEKGMKLYQQTLEIDAPLAACGHCRFTTALDGSWSVEDGRLVFRAALDPLTRRGPSIGGCSEGCHDGRGAIGFRRITVDGEPLTDEQVAMLRSSAASPEAREEEQAT